MTKQGLILIEQLENHCYLSDNVGSMLPGKEVEEVCSSHVTNMSLDTTCFSVCCLCLLKG